MSETMPTEKHVLVCDWVSEDLDPERERLGRAGIALSSAGIAVTDSVDEKRCKLKQAIASITPHRRANVLHRPYRRGDYRPAPRQL